MQKLFSISSVMLVFFGMQAFAVDFEEIGCTTTDGISGLCVPLVQCPNRGPTESSCEVDSVEGVCCIPPPEEGQGGDIRNFFQQRASPRRILPRLGNKEFNEALKSAARKYGEKAEFERRLARENIVAKPGSPAFLRNAHSKMSKSSKKKSQFAEIVLKATQDLAQKHSLSGRQASQAFGAINLRETDLGYESCPEEQRCPRDSKYRTIDGSCNNRFSSTWGQSDIPFLRILDPIYDDGVSSPKSTSVTGRPLSSAREITQALTIANDEFEDLDLTIMLMQWGQFLDHDITLSPISTGEDEAAIACCEDGQALDDDDTHDECYPITIPSDDPFYSQYSQVCMDFVRSLPSVPANCSVSHREQTNTLTAYIDASNVYGSNAETEEKLRSYTDGLLRVNTVLGNDLLPEYPEAEGCDEHLEPFCFLAGDVRVNEQVNLAVMHTLFVREHNRIAETLKDLQPSWDDETLYQEARRIVGALMQHITYNEFLPIVLGPDFMTTFDLYPRLTGYTSSYDSSVDASVANAFATAAYRFGHTLIASFVQGLSAAGELTLNETLSFGQFRPALVYNSGAITAVFRSLTAQRSQFYDNLFTPEIRNKLFAQDEAFGMDLIALNIQRGRDHGLPGYNDFRRACRLDTARSFRDLRNYVADEEIVDTLSDYYDDVDDIDLFLGGILEPSTDDSLLGETFQCIVGEQFYRLKIGDKFYYENGGFDSSFTSSQLEQLRQASLSRVICDNTDISEIQPLSFYGEEVSFRSKETRRGDGGDGNGGDGNGGDGNGGGGNGGDGNGGGGNGGDGNGGGDNNGGFSNIKVSCDELPSIDLSVFV